MKMKTLIRPRAMIPTASMADIAFLLTIFFMVISGHEVDRTTVNLPTAKIREEAEKGAAYVVLAKLVGPGGEEELVYKFSDGNQMSAQVNGAHDIYLEATRLTYVDPTKQFILKADGTVRFERIDELLDNLRKAGVSNVLLLSAQETVKEVAL